jgi:hypothetical protein
MSPKALISALILSTTSLLASQALARPDMTPEQLTKAREVASQMKPPVDFDALLAEADRLDVECKGDLTKRIVIKTCKGYVETAQIKEDTQASRERQAKLDKEIEALEKEIANNIEEAKQIARQKLRQD